MRTGGAGFATEWQGMKLKISDELSLPIDAITRTYAVLGIRGSGKTNTIVDFAEEIIKAGQPVSVIDPLDNWWGLRSSKDGKSAGLKVYCFGGKYQDVPLVAEGGELCARFVVENRLPVILSLKHLRKHEQVRFVAEYAEALYHLNKDPLFQIVDECARYLPQRLMWTTTARGEPNWAVRCLGALSDLFSEGRVSGIGGALIGQRGSRINKDALTQCDVLVSMRTQGPQDRKAMEEWVDAHGTPEQKRIFMAEIASMPTGVGYFWDPVNDIFKKVRFRERETFDSSATPKVGKSVVTPKVYATVDLELLRQKMAATVERAKADDPTQLRAQLAAAKKKIAELETRPPAKVERVEVPVVDESVLKRIREVFEAIERFVGLQQQRARNEFAKLDSWVKENQDTWDSLCDQARHALSTPSTRNVDGRSGRVYRGPVTVVANDTEWYAPALGRRSPDLQKSGGGVTYVNRKGDRTAEHPAMAGSPRSGNPDMSGNGRAVGGAPARMLQALASFPGGSMTRRQLAIAATVPVRTSTFRNAISILKTSGYIDVAGDDVAITDAGCATAPAGAVDQRSIVEMWRNKFGGATLRMLDRLLDRPQGMSRADLASAADVDVSTSTFRNSLSLLRSAGAIIVNRDHVQADESLLTGV